MRKPIRNASAAVLLLLSVVSVGALAPDFTLRDQNGARVSLAAQRGHNVVLVFYRGYW